MDKTLVDDFRIPICDNKKINIIFIQQTQLFKPMFISMEMSIATAEKLNAFLSQALLNADIVKG